MCGVFGVIGNEQIAELLLHGMSNLQHRGQDATGIFTYNPHTDEHVLYKKHGLVNQVFSAENCPAMQKAYWGIGHLRYSTVGMGNANDIQPHLIIKGKHRIAMVHNGNIVNYLPLKNELIANKIDFQTTCDTEVILQMFAAKFTDEECDFETICEAVNEVYTHIFGAYSILGIIAGQGLFAFRDPWGFRPLLYATNGQSHMFSSETGPLSFHDIENLQDLDPGEVMFIDRHLQVHRRKLKQRRHTHCSFEFNYFAKPNAVIENREVYQVRLQLGHALAKKIQEADFDADVVVPIPDTARSSALALARALNLPMEEGFVKQDYVGRTFIMPKQSLRKKAVSAKMTTVSSVFKNKNVILVDDSIIRGTVSQHVVHLARKAGASKVFFASTYPPVRYPCFYGIDFPRQEELIAANKTYEEVCREIGADGLVYNSVEDMTKAIGIDDLCTACLTGKYPTKMEGTAELQNLRHLNLCEMEK